MSEAERLARFPKRLARIPKHLRQRSSVRPERSLDCSGALEPSSWGPPSSSDHLNSELKTVRRKIKGAGSFYNIKWNELSVHAEGNPI